ncbi:MAG: MOSC domain-containing protein [Ilumatobacteraceae bacterium]
MSTVSDAPFEVGPYRFTLTDARRTIANLSIWWQLMTEGMHPVDFPELPAIGARLRATEAEFADRPTAEALGQAWADLLSAAAILRSAHRLPTSGTGAVAQLNRSGGGVPKQPVSEVEVEFGGVVGDRQATRVHHGRPWQALCLWSSEVIASLAAQGHPIRPGGAGENVTISGLDWSHVRPGVRLRIGEVLCECSLYALPCKNTAFNFVDGEFGVMHHERGPVSRMYATVIEPGTIRTGDGVSLEV